MQIRPELTASHDRVWQELAASGAWLTGPERVAVARELRAARDCRLCQERKAALSPRAIEGEHDTVEDNMGLPRFSRHFQYAAGPGPS